MADLILGQPTPLTTMSAGPLGNQRVTFAPWELDWEFFDAINPVFHFVANTTAGNIFPVTAKGGAENLGYWFEVDTVAGTWASGQRCTPQRNGVIAQFPTFLAASIAMADDDQFLVWYSNVLLNRCWSEQILWVDTAGGARGMLSRQQIELIPSGDDIGCAFAGGNLNGMANAVEFINFSMASVGENCIRYAAIGAQWFGPGLIVRRNRIHAGVNGVFIDRCNAGSSIIGANVISGCQVGILLPNDAPEVYVYYNHATRCQEGYHLIPATTEMRDCIGSENGVSFAAVPGCAAAQYCADDDGSLPVHATNLQLQDPRANLRLFNDLARPGDKAFPRDFRSHWDTSLRNRGLATGYAPLHFDMDGVHRFAPPSIGPYEPRGTAYAPAASLVQGATRRGVRS